MRRRPELIAEPDVLTNLHPAGAPAEPDATDRLVLIDALATVPPRQRAIIVLRYLQDLSEADTAATLGISVGAVKSGAARGLARLRSAAPAHFEETGR